MSVKKIGSNVLNEVVIVLLKILMFIVGVVYVDLFLPLFVISYDVFE